MRRKWYWGIIVLTVILFTAGVFLLTQRNIHMEPETENPERRKWLREGESKPGYFHSYDEDGYLVCDENGELIQVRYGDPYFEIFTVIGFRPTYEEYQTYRKLEEQLEQAYKAGNTAERDRLLDEVVQFRADHQGELPDLTATTVYDNTVSESYIEQNRKRIGRMASEKKDQLYREWGLGYLIVD